MHAALRRAEDSADAELAWQQQHTGHQRIRDSLDASLKCELRRGDPDQTHRHILVRELVAAIRSLGAGRLSEALDGSDSAQAPVVAAWDKYAKVAAHADAEALLRQIPAPAASLLVCELIFMRGSGRYLWRFEQALRIFADFRALGRPMDTPLEFSLYLRALNRLGKHRLVIHEVAQYGARAQHLADACLPVAIMRQVVAAYFRGNRPDRAMGVFNDMRRSEHYRGAITPHVYTTVLRGALMAGCLPDTELLVLVDELLDVLQQPDYGAAQRTGLMNEVLTAVGRSGNTGCFLGIFERFAARHTPLNYTTFGILLRNACNAESDARELRQIYHLIVSSEDALLQMNERIFAMFIDNFVRHGRVDYALAVVDDLRGHPHARYTARHLERIFAYYASAGMGRRALELYRDMIDRDGLRPLWSIYVCTVEAVVRDSNLLEEASEADDGRMVDLLGPEAAQVVSIVASSEPGHSGRMRDAFALPDASGPKSVLALAALVLRAHRLVDAYTWHASRGRRGHASAAMSDGEFRELVDQMRTVIDRVLAQSSDDGVPQELYHMAISLFAMARDYETAQRVYDYMVTERSMDPTVETFDVLLRSFARGSSVSTAAELFEELRGQDRPLFRVTGNILIRGFLAAGQPHQAIDVYAYMTGRPTPLADHAEYSDYQPGTLCDAYTFALLITGLVDEALLKEAVVVFEDAFSILPFVPRQLLETLVSRLEESGMVDFAQLCLRRYSRRVENSQPAELQPTGSDNAPDHLPLSYFGYLLSKRS